MLLSGLLSFRTVLFSSGPLQDAIDWTGSWTGSWTLLFMFSMLGCSLRTAVRIFLRKVLVVPVSVHHAKRIQECQTEIGSLLRQHQDALRKSQHREVNLVNASRLGLQRLSGRLFGR